MAPFGCSFNPTLFGDKSVKLVQRLRNYPKSTIYQNPKKTRLFGNDSSSQPTCNFILMMEFRKKIITFRDTIDLPPCSTSISTNQLLLGTLKDLEKFYPGSLPHFHRSELKRLPLDKMLIHFCKALHELGENTSKMSDEWIDKYKYDLYENDKCTNVDKLVEIAMAELNELIKVAKQQFGSSEHGDEGKMELESEGKKSKELKKTSSERSLGCPSPTSVVPGVEATDSPNSSSVTVSFRVQSVGKMSQVDVKRLKLHMFPSFWLNLPSCLNPKKVANDEEEGEQEKENEEEKEKEDNDASSEIKASIVDGNEDPTAENKIPEEPVSSDDHKTADDEGNTELESIEAEVSKTSSPSSPSPTPSAEVLLAPPPSPLPPPDLLQSKVKEVVSRRPPLPSPLPQKLESNVVENEKELPSTKTVIPPPPLPPPAFLQPKVKEVVSRGFPPPLPQKLESNVVEKEKKLPSTKTVIPPLPLPPPAFLQPKVKEVVSRGPPLPPPLPQKLGSNVVEKEKELPSTKTVIPPPPLTPPTFLQPEVKEIVSRGPPLPPPLPQKLESNVVEKEQELPSTMTVIPMPPPPPPAPLKSTVVAKEEPPLPPPVLLQSEASASEILAPTHTISRTFTKKCGPLPPPPPPPMSAANGATPPPPPPPPMSAANGDTPPPPPPPMSAANGATPLPPMSAANGATPPPPMSAANGATPPPPMSAANGDTPPPPPPPMSAANGATPPPPPPPPMSAANGATSPPPPPPVSVVNGATPTPPPPPMLAANGATPPPPPPMSATNGATPPLPPPPTSAANGATPPPPPPPGGGVKSARTRRTSSKLKRSIHMGNLYRNLKGKVEGSPVQGKSFGKKKGGVKSNTNGKQGMADALAEMTRRSSYFQKIEEDVEKYAKSIHELKVAIGKFNTKDMPELLKFHKYVESILENLTDETQVLARYEGFPTKKLEALRTSSSLYSKLDSMMNELSLKAEPPLSKFLDKATRSFNKIKGDIDSLERTKDIEAKTFKTYGIEFDFQIITRIKEAMVDVSSNCMELALEERREVNMEENEGFKTKDGAQNKASNKLLWRVFQFAFQVYTFAGGHDDRAEKLTQELAHEIENDAEYQIEVAVVPTPRRRKHKPRNRNKNSCPT